jgi:catalase
VAKQLGLAAPKPPANGTTGNGASHAADGNGTSALLGVDVSPALSQITGDVGPIATRKVAFLAADGVDADAVDAMRTALAKAGAVVHVLAPHLGTLEASRGTIAVDHTIVTMPSVAYDAVFVPGGAASVETLQADGDAVHFVAEAFKHAKAIAATDDGESLLREAGVRTDDSGIGDATSGVIVASGDAGTIADSFIEAIGRHRAWSRAGLTAIPA